MKSRVGGPRNQFGRFGEEINPLPLPRFEPQTVKTVDMSLYNFDEGEDAFIQQMKSL
jgi:hypothetical protein